MPAKTQLRWQIIQLQGVSSWYPNCLQRDNIRALNTITVTVTGCRGYFLETGTLILTQQDLIFSVAAYSRTHMTPTSSTATPLRPTPSRNIRCLQLRPRKYQIWFPLYPARRVPLKGEYVKQRVIKQLLDELTTEMKGSESLIFSQICSFIIAADIT